MSKYTNAAYNAALEILVKWNANEFVIIGDDRKVSDKVLNALMAGKTVAGWEPEVLF